MGTVISSLKTNRLGRLALRLHGVMCRRLDDLALSVVITEHRINLLALVLRR
jgi:hypothetical protein